MCFLPFPSPACPCYSSAVTLTQCEGVSSRAVFFSISFYLLSLSLADPALAGLVLSLSLRFVSFCLVCVLVW